MAPCSQGIVLRNLLHRTTHVSRPLVPTVRIQAGPQAHERDSHFATYEGPGLDRFGIVAPTFWAGHLPPPIQETWRRVSPDEKDGTGTIPSS
jgi:hypothetical protein